MPITPLLGPKHATAGVIISLICLSTHANTFDSQKSKLHYYFEFEPEVQLTLSTIKVPKLIDEPGTRTGRLTYPMQYIPNELNFLFNRVQLEAFGNELL